MRKDANTIRFSQEAKGKNSCFYAVVSISWLETSHED